MKIVSPDILHKTEAGGVLVGLKSPEQVVQGFETIIQNARHYKPEAEILGVQIQQMLHGGQEVIIGAVTDPAFGKLVAFGLGGILVEVLKDITFRLAPASYEDALSMLDGIAAAEILRGVRGAAGVDRRALASIIERVGALVSDFPEISELDLNPVFATERAAIAADVRVVLDFNPAPARYRPSQELIVQQMNRIMKPDAVAVIGASAEAGKIGNSVMKNLINGGYQGAIYPIHPTADTILDRKAYKSVKDVPGEIDVAVFAIPAKLVAQALIEVGEKQIAGAVLIPSGFAETGNVAGQAELVEIGRKYGVRLMGPNIYGFYYTPKNLCATFCTAYDVKGKAALSSQSGGIGMAIIGFSRSAKMGVSAIVGLGNKADIDEDDLLTFFEQDDNTEDHCAALRGSEGWPLVRGSCTARLEEKADRSALRSAAPAWVRRALRARTPARSPVMTRSTKTCSGTVRDPCALAAGPAGIRARHTGAAHAQRQQCRDHHWRRWLRRAAVGCLRRQRPVTDDDARGSRCGISQIHSAVRRRRQSSRHHRRRAAADLSEHRAPGVRRNARIHALILGYWHTIVTPPMVFARLMVEVVQDMRSKGIAKPVVASLAGDIEVEEAAEYRLPARHTRVRLSGPRFRWQSWAPSKWARGADHQQHERAHTHNGQTDYPNC